MGRGFFDKTPKAQSTEKKSGKLNFFKIKNISASKDNIKMKRQATFWMKIFAKCKGFAYRIYQELLQFNIKKTTQFKKWTKMLSRHVTKEDIGMANKHMERCSTSVVIREI